MESFDIKHEKKRKFWMQNEDWYKEKQRFIDSLGLDGLYKYLESFETYIIPEKKEQWKKTISQLIYNNE